MMGTEWLYGAIALLVGLHILTMLYAYRRRGDPATAGRQSDSEHAPSVHPDEKADVVSCQHCGARNQPGYQFCKQCVADLSSGGPPRQMPEKGQPY